MHFGLGQEATVGEVALRWPIGDKEILKDVPADFIYTIAEGKGITDKSQLPPIQ